jgi:hypothetical protein
LRRIYRHSRPASALECGLTRVHHRADRRQSQNCAVGNDFF